VQIRFVDSVTGCAIQPEGVALREKPDAVEQYPGPVEVTRSGRTAILLEHGTHTLTATAPSYKPMTGDLRVASNSPCNIRILLDPEVVPPELQTGYIDSQRRDDATVILGFVSDEETGQPLSKVRVWSAPSGAETRTDARGFFQIHVPVQSESDARVNPASLVFEKDDYQTLERQYLELWPDGDWKYIISLQPGKGKQAIDERALRRWNSYPTTQAKSETTELTTTLAPAAPESFQPFGVPTPQLTAASNSTVRVPRNIRVLQTNGITVDYVSLDTYCKHVLPAEWIASWGNIVGGSNSLNAGAVAIRSYAIAKLNGVSSSSAFDICGTTSCQVYRPDISSSLTDTAVNYTANWVVLNSLGSIFSTEYSAENNSLANSCGDGFTEPSTTGPVCIYDPVCSGETRSGHGRGMCQWGTAKWATGRKFTGNSTGNTATNGYPRRDWGWIVQHYYPTNTLIKGAPLIVGDDIKALKTLDVRACPDGSISNGIYCGLVATKAASTTGTIIGGPVQIAADASGTNGPGGFTWYQVQWSDSAIGWSQENYLERVFSTPSDPANLVASARGTNQIGLSWTDTSAGMAAGFKLERAITFGGPWLQITNIIGAITTNLDKDLPTGSTWYYRVRAYNAGGNSAYTVAANATTSNTPPVLTAIGNKTIGEGATLTFTNSASSPETSQLITDFQPFVTEGSNGVVMFRNPRFSSSTASFMETNDFAIIADLFPTNGNTSARALRINCNFTNASNPWLRLTTFNGATFPNPVIDFTKRLRFSVYSDRTIQMAVGCRETTTASGIPIGSDGGTAGGIEWAGVTNISGTAPMPTRTVAASNWTTLTFDFPNEPIRNFSGGNGILSTASGLGVLEHVAIVPAAGTGVYNVFLDNFTVVASRALTYVLGPGAPAGTAVNPTNGVFTWTPAETQGPGSNSIAVIVTDDSSPAMSATNAFTVMVNEVNSPPTLAAISDRMVHAGSMVAFTNSATDQDIPTNTLIYSLDIGAPPQASIGSNSGVFSWLTGDNDANTTNAIAVRVTDNGAPPLDDVKGFTITVLPRPAVQNISISGTNVTVTWSAIKDVTYRVQFKTDLEDAAWIDLVPDVTASGVTASLTDAVVPTQRFYRVVVLN
jgi:hypothetical protein